MTFAWSRINKTIEEERAKDGCSKTFNEKCIEFEKLIIAYSDIIKNLIFNIIIQECSFNIAKLNEIIKNSDSDFKTLFNNSLGDIFNKFGLLNYENPSM